MSVWAKAALNLLDDPRGMHGRSNEGVRSILSKALFGRLYVDGRKITGQDYQEPFDALMEAYDVVPYPLLEVAAILKQLFGEPLIGSLVPALGPKV